MRRSTTQKLTRPKFVQVEEQDESNKLNCYKKLEDVYRNKKAFEKDENQMPHNRKLLKNMLKRLQSRGESFYRFGFRSYQKYKKLNFLEDILNLKKKQTCGTISLAELWPNRNMVQYLKSNNMFLNKKQLLIELKLLQKQEAKLQNDPHLITMNQIETKAEIKYLRPTAEPTLSADLKTLNMKLIKISQQLSKLNTDSINRSNRDIEFDGLEKTAKRFKKLEHNYLLQMIEMA